MSSIVEEILSRADIVEIISSYYPLKKAGKNYRTHCPFHPERNPSFTVSPEKQIFHCFGCGVGGNVINFIMLEEKVEWKEAVRILAEKLGISLKEWKGENTLYSLMEKASIVFRKFLLKPEGKSAFEYLEKRGVSLEISERFKLGYAPPVNWLKELEDFSSQDLIKGGLALEREKEIYPYFRNRVIFPIFSLTGKIIAFGGRTLEEIEPKYLNSPDTPIFQKGRILYGLNFAKQEMMKKKEAILVEGYMDFLSLFQEGYENICACLGTSLTENQALLISRYAEKVNLLFDPDEAGEKATLRAIEMFWKAGVVPRVVVLPQGYDPDSFVKERGKEGMDRMISQSEDGLEFYLSKLQKIEERNLTRILEKCFQAWEEMKEIWRRDEFLEKSAHLLSLSLQTVKDMWVSYRKKRKFYLPNVQQLPPSSEIHLLSLLLNFPEERQNIISKLPMELISDSTIKGIIEKLGEVEEEINIPNFFEKLSEEEKRVLSGVLMKEIPHKDPLKEANDCIEKLKQREIGRLKMEISHLEKEGKWEKVVETLKRLDELKRRRV
ncbi:DNA primase [Candidatus Calescamantes bacterium]|nr:DNA primase [Candidatus Calescamantes bacterium]